MCAVRPIYTIWSPVIIVLLPELVSWKYPSINGTEGSAWTLVVLDVRPRVGRTL